MDNVVVVQPNIVELANHRDRSIRDYATFDPITMNTGIVRPEITANHFEFKLVMFFMLQTMGQFSGLPQEDPHLHLKLFVEVESNFKFEGITDDAFQLRLFPYSLKDHAKAWLNSLEPNSVYSWNVMAEKFLTKYFPSIKNARMRKDIISFGQLEEETLFEAWERFKELLRKCPHHGIPVCIQMETFYIGLQPPSRLILDASSGGALMSKSYNEAYALIECIAENSYQWSTASLSSTVKMDDVNEVSALSTQFVLITHMLETLTFVSPSAATNSAAPIAVKIEPAVVVQDFSHVNAIFCGYCGGGHLYEECPSNLVSANYMGNYNGGNNPNVSWSKQGDEDSNYQAKANHRQKFHPPGQQSHSHPQVQSTNQDVGLSLEATLNTVMNESQIHCQNQIVAMRNLENQLGQLATTLSAKLSGPLPSSTYTSMPIEIEQCHAINLRNGKENSAATQKIMQKNSAEFLAAPVTAPVTKQNFSKLAPEIPPPPFPQRLKKFAQDKQFGNWHETKDQRAESDPKRGIPASATPSNSVAIRKIMQKNSAEPETGAIPAPISIHVTTPAPEFFFPKFVPQSPPQKEFYELYEMRNTYPKCLVVGTWEHLLLYAKYMGFLHKKRKRKDDIFYVSYYPP